MGFFKDFKDDLSQAVNDLVPVDDQLDTAAQEDDLMVNTLEGEMDVQTEFAKVDSLFEPVTKPVMENRSAAAQAARESAPITFDTKPVMKDAAVNITKAVQEEKNMDDTMTTPMMAQSADISDEVSVITEGTVIRGDVVSNGSLDVRGQIEGNVGCNGKLVVTGVINGNSNASEVFADAAKIEGEVVSTGTVKIGLGSVIIGNVTSASAVIAGAIKGDIDVQGPVVVDTSAVVMGNIKSRSVQINNGAVIEGFCSQCYADVDVQSLFGTEKGNTESQA